MYKLKKIIFKKILSIFHLEVFLRNKNKFTGGIFSCPWNV